MEYKISALPFGKRAVYYMSVIGSADGAARARAQTRRTSVPHRAAMPADTRARPQTGAKPTARF